jgi:hypothetical protein
MACTSFGATATTDHLSETFSTEQSAAVHDYFGQSCATERFCMTDEYNRRGNSRIGDWRGHGIVHGCDNWFHA